MQHVRSGDALQHTIGGGCARLFNSRFAPLPPRLMASRRLPSWASCSEHMTVTERRWRRGQFGFGARGSTRCMIGDLARWWAKNNLVGATHDFGGTDSLDSGASGQALRTLGVPSSASKRESGAKRETRKSDAYYRNRTCDLCISSK